jgi:predicted ATP-dependent protease
MTLGGLSFGNPSRITARIRLGGGEVVDIEREVELGGPLHSKGVLILRGFLGGRFGKTRPLSLNASLVFEQSYGGVDGDSASAAELFALLSALAEVPVRQSLAVTGSVDQLGRIQAIGGVNEKIEGFFDACGITGSSRRQGVIIPASNVKHLMLRQDVVAAATEEQFRIIPIETVDQGMTLLTGLPAGEPDAQGNYPEGTINRRIAVRLDAFAAKAAELARDATSPRTVHDAGG